MKEFEQVNTEGLNPINEHQTPLQLDELQGHKRKTMPFTWTTLIPPNLRDKNWTASASNKTQTYQKYCLWFRNPVNLAVEVGSLSYCLQGCNNIPGGWEWDFCTINSIKEWFLTFWNILPSGWLGWNNLRYSPDWWYSFMVMIYHGKQIINHASLEQENNSIFFSQLQRKLRLFRNYIPSSSNSPFDSPKMEITMKNLVPWRSD